MEVVGDAVEEVPVWAGSCRNISHSPLAERAVTGNGGGIKATVNRIAMSIAHFSLSIFIV
jgi:hypothetical protein